MATFTFNPVDPLAQQWEAREATGIRQIGKKRKVIPTEHGASLMSNGTSEVYGGNCENVPRIPAHFRWDGVCEYLPQDWAIRARARVENLRNVRVVCQGCCDSDQPPPADGLLALAWASDHDATKLDHKIYLLDSVGNVVAENDFHPVFGREGRTHRAAVKYRENTMRPWQRTIL